MNNLFQLVIALFLILIAAVAVKKLLEKKTKELHGYPYEKEHALFSPAERSLLGVLDMNANGSYRFMGKVRLADIIKVKGKMNKSSRQNAFNRIQSKHVDIVACDPATLIVQFVIELDDSTHSQPKRRNRDDFVDNALKAAGVPVVHVAAKRVYSEQDIQHIFTQAGM